MGRKVVKLKPLFRLTGMKHNGDCVVAAIAMALNIPYEEVLVVASRIQPHVLMRGLYTVEAQLIADAFGRSLMKKLKPDVEEDAGILMLKMGSKEWRRFAEHAVFLTNGLVFAPECGGEIWDVEAYLSANKSTVLHLLEEK